MSGIISVGELSFQIIIIMIILLSLTKGAVSLNKEPRLIAVKQLTSVEKLLVILDKGLYLYEQDLSNYINIYEFNLEQQNALRENNNLKILFSQFMFRDIDFYSCLIKNDLFIYNPINKHIYHLSLNLKENIEPIFMNINNSNLSLYFIKDKSFTVKIISLFSEFKIKEAKSSVIYIFKNSSFVNCKMNNINYIKCFYYNSSFNTVELSFNNTNYLIKENKNNISLFYNNKNIIKILSDASYDKNHFICFLKNDYKSNCLILNKLNNKINYLFNTSEEFCINIIVRYFKETNQFVFVCQKKVNYLLLIIKNSIFDINKNIYQTKIFSISDNDNYFSIIYNKFIKDYSIIGNFNFTGKIL